MHIIWRTLAPEPQDDKSIMPPAGHPPRRLHVLLLVLPPLTWQPPQTSGDLAEREQQPIHLPGHCQQWQSQTEWWWHTANSQMLVRRTRERIELTHA